MGRKLDEVIGKVATCDKVIEKRKVSKKRNEIILATEAILMKLFLFV